MEIIHEFGSAEFKEYKTFHARVVVAGDSAVGKSTILKVIEGSNTEISDLFTPTSFPTFIPAFVKIPDENSEKKPAQVDFLFLDTPGEIAYNGRETAAGPVWATCDGIVLVFDLGNRESFQSLNKWIRRWQEARETAGVTKPIFGVIVGNKSDFRHADVDRAVVSEEEAKQFANTLSLRYFEVSSLHPESVKAPFVHLSNLVVRSQESES